MKKTLLVLGSVLLLQGCAAAIVAGTAGAVTAATDRRTIGTQIDDNAIEIKAGLAIEDNDRLKNHTNINIVSLNGVVLMLGQAPNDDLKSLAYRTVEPIPGVRKIHNQVRLGSITGISTRTHDVWLTSKVKTRLLTEEKLSANNIKVVTENSEVFLMGIVTEAEAQLAVEIARNISGVNRVIKVFEYL